MQAISAEQVAQTQVWLESLEDESAIEALIDRIAEEQPFLFAYLVTMGEGDLNEDEQELLLYLGLAVWQMLSRGEQPLSQVSESDLDRLEQENMRLIESLSGDTEAEFLQKAQSMLKDYAQPAILSFVLESVMEEESEVLRPSNRGIVIVFLKIMIDCLDQGRTS